MFNLETVGKTLPGVARRAIEAWVRSRERLQAAQPDAPAAPVFVTLRDPAGALRGCIGSLSPSEPDVVAETVRSAILAATRDPRFQPVSPQELPGLHIEVSVLMPEQAIVDPSELDPQRYGVVVRGASGRQGLLLPQVPGVEDVASQVAIAKRKAGLPPDAEVTLSRFEVAKFE